MWAPPRMLAVTVAALAQMRSSVGTVFALCGAVVLPFASANVRPRNPLREVPIEQRIAEFRQLREPLKKFVVLLETLAEANAGIDDDLRSC